MAPAFVLGMAPYIRIKLLGKTDSPEMISANLGGNESKNKKNLIIRAKGNDVEKSSANQRRNGAGQSNQNVTDSDDTGGSSGRTAWMNMVVNATLAMAFGIVSNAMNAMTKSARLVSKRNGTIAITR